VQVVNESPAELLSALRRVPQLSMDTRHEILAKDIHPKRLEKIFLKTYERHPSTFLELLTGPDVGAKTMRALALVSELVYGSQPSFSDPARFSFAHGGKDGIPYPVDRGTYEHTIDTLREIVNSAKVGHAEKKRAFERLRRFEKDAGS